MTEPVPTLAAALAGRYRLERELGHGGMATVYLARDLKHDRPVALKVLRPELAAALGTDRFLREVKITARLNHPHILPLLDSGEAEGFLYYVMPYVEGESLRDRLEREKQLPLDDALQIAREVADALSYAHSHDVVHRDIKPENILLESGHAVVADFGIARAITAAGGDKLTDTGIAVGTPAYMCPEQAAGERTLDGRSDTYSLGCVLYEMLAGRPPFTGPTVESIVHQHLTAEASAVSMIRAAVPAPVVGALRRALAKTPADRFTTAAQFGEELGLRPTAAPPEPPVTRRRRWRIAIGLGAAALVLGIGVVATLRVTQPEVPGPAERAARRANASASVAVMPFDNLSGQPGDEYLSDGMTEEIIGQLAQVQALKVISRTSVVALKRSGLTLPQIAETLGVRHILEGSVRRAGNRIRVAVQLIDAGSDAHLWAESYNRDLTDVFAVQEEIARQVSAALVTTVGGGLRPVGGGSRTGQPPAYESYLRGRYLWHRRTADGLWGSIRAFQQTIALDSAFAPAYAGLASAYGLLATYDYAGIDLYIAYGRAVAMADRAIALDPDLAEGYAGRGYVLTRGWAPVDPIAGDFRRALQLRPNSADVHGWYAHYLSRVGLHDSALAEAERAIDLDPLAPGRRYGLAIDALSARRYDLTLREAQRAVALEPSLMVPRQLEAIAQLLLGRPDACALVSLGPYVAVRAMCLHALGRAREAEAVIDSLAAAAETGGPPDSVYSSVIRPRGLAEYYAWIGDARRAIQWLERAFAISPEGEDFRILPSGVYDRVRSAPAFRDGLERIRRTQYERLTREIRNARGGR